MDAFISGAWRTVRRGEVTIGGAPRLITRVEVYRSGAWYRDARFTSPLTVTAPSVDGTVFSQRGSAYVTSSPSQATPSGGLSPYSYLWSITSGTVTSNTPTSASNTFAATVNFNSTKTATARVTCTDALGATAFADITITLNNESNL